MKPEMLPFLVVILAIVGAMANVVLRAMRRSRAWPRVTATVVSDVSRRWGPIYLSYSGQPIPITFDVPNGGRVTSSLKLSSEESPPLPGTTIEIVYDPTDPRRVEYYTSNRAGVLLLLVIGGFLAFGLGIIWVGAQR